MVVPSFSESLGMRPQDVYVWRLLMPHAEKRMTIDGSTYLLWKPKYETTIGLWHLPNF